MLRSTLLNSPAMNRRFLTNVRFVESEDAQFIVDLRSNQNLNQHISKTAPDVKAQRQWILKYKEREMSGEEFYFVICHDEQDLGVVRMYDFKDGSFCWGSWIILPSRPSGLVTFSAVMIYEMGFDALGFNQSHFDVRLENKRVIDFHLRSGAEPTKRDDVDQFFVFPKSKWPRFKENCVTQIHAHRIAKS
ncbi:MAG: GNAT family N-acetyltransferase [Pseudomonadota bacterium]